MSNFNHIPTGQSGHVPQSSYMAQQAQSQQPQSVVGAQGAQPPFSTMQELAYRPPPTVGYGRKPVYKHVRKSGGWTGITRDGAPLGTAANIYRFGKESYNMSTSQRQFFKLFFQSAAGLTPRFDRTWVPQQAPTYYRTDGKVAYDPYAPQAPPVTQVATNTTKMFTLDGVECDQNWFIVTYDHQKMQWVYADESRKPLPQGQIVRVNAYETEKNHDGSYSDRVLGVNSLPVLQDPTNAQWYQAIRDTNGKLHFFINNGMKVPMAPKLTMEAFKQNPQIVQFPNELPNFINLVDSYRMSLIVYPQLTHELHKLRINPEPRTQTMITGLLKNRKQIEAAMLPYYAGTQAVNELAKATSAHFRALVNDIIGKSLDFALDQRNIPSPSLDDLEKNLTEFFMTDPIVPQLWPNTCYNTEASVFKALEYIISKEPKILDSNTTVRDQVAATIIKSPIKVASLPKLKAVAFDTAVNWLNLPQACDFVLAQVAAKYKDNPFIFAERENTLGSLFPNVLAKLGTKPAAPDAAWTAFLAALKGVLGQATILMKTNQLALEKPQASWLPRKLTEDVIPKVLTMLPTDAKTGPELCDTLVQYLCAFGSCAKLQPNNGNSNNNGTQIDQFGNRSMVSAAFRMIVPMKAAFPQFLDNPTIDPFLTYVQGVEPHLPDLLPTVSPARDILKTSLRFRDNPSLATLRTRLGIQASAHSSVAGPPSHFSAATGVGSTGSGPMVGLQVEANTRMGTHAKEHLDFYNRMYQQGYKLLQTPYTNKYKFCPHFSSTGQYVYTRANDNMGEFVWDTTRGAVQKPPAEGGVEVDNPPGQAPVPVGAPPPLSVGPNTAGYPPRAPQSVGPYAGASGFQRPGVPPPSQFGQGQTPYPAPNPYGQQPKPPPTQPYAPQQMDPYGQPVPQGPGPYPQQPPSQAVPNPYAPQATGAPNPYAPQATGAPNPYAPQATGAPNPYAPQGDPNPYAPQGTGAPNPYAPQVTGAYNPYASRGAPSPYAPAPSRQQPYEAAPPQGYPPQDYLPQDYPPQDYPPQNYPPQGYAPPPQGYGGDF